MKVKRAYTASEEKKKGQKVLISRKRYSLTEKGKQAFAKRDKFYNRIPGIGTYPETTILFVLARHPFLGQKTLFDKVNENVYVFRSALRKVILKGFVKVS